DIFMDNLFANNPLGQPILGSPENIRRFGRDDIRTYVGKEFSPDRVVVAIAGNFDLRRVEPHLRRVFENVQATGGESNPLLSPAAAYKSRNVDRKLEQAYFCVGTTGPSRRD